MLRSLLFALLGVVFIGSAVPAWAAETGPNGGMLAGKRGHQTELVVSPTDLTVYIIDHGKVHSSEGVSLRAVVQEGGKSSTVTLADDGGKRLVGKLSAPLGKGAIVVLTGKDDHGNAVSARYVME